MLAGALAVMGLAGSAVGSVTITSVNRSTEVFARASAAFVGPNVSDSDQESSAVTGLFQSDLGAAAVSEQISVEAAASQDSFVNGSFIGGTGSVSGSAPMISFGDVTEIYAESLMSVGFQVSVPTPVSMAASLAPVGGYGDGGINSVMLYNDGWDILFELEFSGSGNYDAVLQPGSYTLYVVVRIDFIETSSTTGPFMGEHEWDVSLAIIPAPGSLAILAFGGLMASRRRR